VLDRKAEPGVSLGASWIPGLKTQPNDPACLRAGTRSRLGAAARRSAFAAPSTGRRSGSRCSGRPRVVAAGALSLGQIRNMAPRKRARLSQGPRSPRKPMRPSKRPSRAAHELLDDLRIAMLPLGRPEA
jgi:hypothetical protein